MRGASGAEVQAAARVCGAGVAELSAQVAQHQDRAAAGDREVGLAVHVGGGSGEVGTDGGGAARAGEVRSVWADFAQ